MRRFILVFCALTLLLALSAGSASAWGDCYYTVGYGDTLARIAARYGTTWSALASANNIWNPNWIYVGQSLYIPSCYQAPPPYQPPYQPPPPPPYQPPWQPPVYGTTYYTVGYGDTLNRIAARFGTTYQAIASVNGIWNPNLIYVGQTLIIPTY